MLFSFPSLLLQCMKKSYGDPGLERFLCLRELGNELLLKELTTAQLDDIAKRKRSSHDPAGADAVTLRVSMCFSRARTNRTFVFATTEAGRLLPGTLSCRDHATDAAGHLAAAGLAAGGGVGGTTLDTQGLLRISHHSDCDISKRHHHAAPRSSHAQRQARRRV